MLMQIFLLCRHPAADVPLDLLMSSTLRVSAASDGLTLRKALGDVLMYRTLLIPKCFAACRTVVLLSMIYLANLHSFLFPQYNLFKPKTPAILVFTLYARVFCIMQERSF